MPAFRTVALLLGIMLLSTTGVFSQEKKDPVTKDSSTAKVKGKLPTYWSKLGLSDSQKQDAYKLVAKYTEQIQKLEDQVRSLRAEERKELDKILTPEQKKHLVELQTGEPTKKE